MLIDANEWFLPQGWRCAAVGGEDSTDRTPTMVGLEDFLQRKPHWSPTLADRPFVDVAEV